MSEPLSPCCALTPSIPADRSMTCCQSAGPKDTHCVRLSEYTTFPALSSSNLGGSDTNSYKASIIKRKVAASVKLMVCAEGQPSCYMSAGVLPHTERMNRDERISVLCGKDRDISHMILYSTTTNFHHIVVCMLRKI